MVHIAFNLFEARPVEGDTVTRALRRNSVSIIDHKRALKVAIQPETVGFEIAPVRTSREQVHGHVVGAMRGDRQIECLGQVRDLHERGDAAAICDIGLRISNTARCDEVLELPQRAQVLAGGDRHPAFTNDAGVAGDIIRDDRFLEPDQLKR